MNKSVWGGLVVAALLVWSTSQPAQAGQSTSGKRPIRLVSQTTQPAQTPVMSTALAFKALNLVGHDRKEVVAALGIPQRTEVSREPTLAYWEWILPAQPGDVSGWFVLGCSSNVTKKLVHLVIRFGASVQLTTVLDQLAPATPSLYKGDYGYFGAITKLRGGLTARIYAQTAIESMVEAPYLDDSGNRQTRFVTNPKFVWKRGTVYRIAVGDGEFYDGSWDPLHPKYYIKGAPTWLVVGK